MFNPFKSPRHSDALLGELRYSRGLWRGEKAIDGVRVPLTVWGSRSAPFAEAMALASSAQDHLDACRGTIEAELFAHSLAYAEAVAAGECQPDEAFAPIETPSMVWAHASPAFVAVAPLDGTLTIELGYTVAWEEEHTLGVRLQPGQWVELCGSTIAP